MRLYFAFLMGRPRRIPQPVKLNLLIDRESKMGAISLAAKRKMSVGRLFEALLSKEQAELAKIECLPCEKNIIDCNTGVVEAPPCLDNIVTPESPLEGQQPETQEG